MESREDWFLAKKVPISVETVVGVLMYLGGRGRMGVDEYPRMLVPATERNLRSNGSNRRLFRAITGTATK